MYALEWLLIDFKFWLLQNFSGSSIYYTFKFQFSYKPGHLKDINEHPEIREEIVLVHENEHEVPDSPRPPATGNIN